MHQTKYSPLILDEIERIISSDLQDEDDQDFEGRHARGYSSKSGVRSEKREHRRARRDKKM